MISESLANSAGWTPGSGPSWTQRADPNGLLYILFHSKGNANTTGYSNPKVDELLEQAAGTYELERRRPLYSSAERMITDEVPYVFLNYTAEFAVMSRKVQNWGWIPDLIPRFRDLFNAASGNSIQRSRLPVLVIASASGV